MSVHDDAEANRRHVEALVGGRTRWREHIERGSKVLGIQWDKLPLRVRQQWWRETDYDRRPPAAEFMARLPQVLADAQAEVASDKREIAAATAGAREYLRRHPPPIWRRLDLLRLRCWRYVDAVRYLPRRIALRFQSPLPFCMECEKATRSPCQRPDCWLPAQLAAQAAWFTASKEKRSNENPTQS